MIKIVAKKLVKEDRVEDFKKIVRELVEKSLAEEGNVFPVFTSPAAIGVIKATVL